MGVRSSLQLRSLLVILVVYWRLRRSYKRCVFGFDLFVTFCVLFLSSECFVFLFVHVFSCSIFNSDNFCCYLSGFLFISFRSMVTCWWKSYLPSFNLALFYPRELVSASCWRFRLTWRYFDRYSVHGDSRDNIDWYRWRASSSATVQFGWLHSSPPTKDRCASASNNADQVGVR